MYGSTRKCPLGSVAGEGASIGPVHQASSVDSRATADGRDATVVSAACCVRAPGAMDSPIAQERIASARRVVGLSCIDVLGCPCLSKLLHVNLHAGIGGDSAHFDIAASHGCLFSQHPLAGARMLPFGVGR